MQNIQNISRNPATPVPPFSYVEEILRLIDGLPPDSELVLHGQSWEDYESVLEAVGEAAGLRIAFDGETLQIMTTSTSHEKYVRLLERLIGALSMRLGIDVESYGSSTIKLSEVMKGLEPDACYYVQNVEAIGGRSEIDFSVDPMPDIAVEIDIHNVSLQKLAIYSSLGFPEVWRYHRDKFEFYRLEEGEYTRIEKSDALPILTPDTLTSYLNRGRSEKQTQILKDFENWLKKQRNKPEWRNARNR